MSEEEKRTKKQKIEDNRRLRAVSQSLSMLSTCSYSPSTAVEEKPSHFPPLMSEETFDEDSNDHKYLFYDEQRVFLTKIEEHYRQAVRLNVSVIPGCDHPCLRNLSGIVHLLNEPGQICALRMITFFKLTPEFNVCSSPCSIKESSPSPIERERERVEFILWAGSWSRQPTATGFKQTLSLFFRNPFWLNSVAVFLLSTFVRGQSNQSEPKVPFLSFEMHSRNVLSVFLGLTRRRSFSSGKA